MVIQASPSHTAPTDSVDQVDQMMDLDRGTATATPPTTADAAMSFLIVCIIIGSGCCYESLRCGYKRWYW